MVVSRNSDSVISGDNAQANFFSVRWWVFCSYWMWANETLLVDYNSVKSWRVLQTFSPQIPDSRRQNFLTQKCNTCSPAPTRRGQDCSRTGFVEEVFDH